MVRLYLTIMKALIQRSRFISVTIIHLFLLLSISTSISAQGVFDIYKLGYANVNTTTDDDLLQNNGNFNSIIFGSFTTNGLGNTEERLAVQGQVLNTSNPVDIYNYSIKKQV